MSNATASKARTRGRRRRRAAAAKPPEALVDAASAAGRILGVRISVDDDDEEPWLAPPSRRRPPPDISGELPRSLNMVMADQLHLPRKALPPPLVARRESYAAQALRLATHDQLPIVSCAELTPSHIGLPRGCLDVAADLITSFRITLEIEDRRVCGAAPRRRPLAPAAMFR